MSQFSQCKQTNRVRLRVKTVQKRKLSCAQIRFVQCTVVKHARYKPNSLKYWSVFKMSKDNEITVNDASRQDEEIEALAAIYGDDFLMVNSTEKCFDVRIRCEDNPWWSLTIQVLLPQNYPSSGPPVFEIHGTWLQEADDLEIRDRLYAIFRENEDELVVFQWVEALREFINEKAASCAGMEEFEAYEQTTDTSEPQNPTTFGQSSSHDKVNIPSLKNWQSDDNLPEILHGEPITDRKSTFQAHLVQVTSEQDVRDALHELKKTRKIANATHNISAYRIKKKNSPVAIQDCDDDGENNAGSRLLHLLQILNVENYLIVVSRWYGGILLGPDRFKHINNSARNLLKAADVIRNNATKHESHLKGNKIKMRKTKNK